MRKLIVIAGLLGALTAFTTAQIVVTPTSGGAATSIGATAWPLTAPTGATAVLRTGTTAGDTLSLAAYDTDTGPGYVNLLTLTSGTNPSASLTILTNGGVKIGNYGGLTGALIANNAMSAYWTTYSIALKLGNVYTWDGDDLYITREAAAILQLGSDVNGSAVHQQLKSADGVTGTDIAGASLTLAGGRGTGAGAPGTLIFQTATALASGTTAQTLATRLTIAGTTGASSFGDIATQDVLAFLPATSATRFTGTFTPADLTANVTWTMPAATGTVALVGYGDMYAYENATATTIALTNTYQAVHGIFTTGASLSGVTFTAGSTGPIASVAEGTVGDGIVVVTDVAHGLVSNDIITIANSTDYDGQFIVTRVDNDTFTILETWTSTRTGTWNKGDYLTVATAGVYHVVWSVSAGSASSTAENYKIEPVHQIDDIDEGASESTINNGAGLSVFGGGSLHTLAAGDRIWIKLKQTTAGTDSITLSHGNLRVLRVGS